MSRDRLPPIEDDETFYHADLVGLAAVTPDGAPLGTVTAIHNFGAGDLVEIKPPGGGEPLMVPFTEAAVPEIDIAGGPHGRGAADRDRVMAMWRATILTLFPEMFPGTARAKPRRQGAGVRRLVARRP